jgi:hypothetical protein
LIKEAAKKAKVGAEELSSRIAAVTISVKAKAGEEGKLEAMKYETDSIQQLQALVARASGKKEPTVDKLVTMMMQVE